jgi:hypothetical protein
MAYVFEFPSILVWWEDDVLLSPITKEGADALTWLIAALVPLSVSTTSCKILSGLYV